MPFWVNRKVQSVLKREALLNYSEFLAATKEKESVELVSGNMPELGMSFLVGLGMGKFEANLGLEAIRQRRMMQAHLAKGQAHLHAPQFEALRISDGFAI